MYQQPLAVAGPMRRDVPSFELIRGIAFSLMGPLLAACNGGGSQLTGPAPDQPVLAFQQAAVSANGDYPAADPKTICGSDDRRFLAELAEGSALDSRVPLRLADIKASPSELMVSGSATNVSLVAADFPPDHTFGSDFTMDVELDPPYAKAAQKRAAPGGNLHVELAQGQLPHDPGPAGPAAGQEWEIMSERVHEGIDRRFVPDPTARVLVMGNWVIDCGDPNYQTELHPITFLATARITGAKTVVSAFYNPYRETQRYHPDPAKALAFDDPSRFQDPGAGPFPATLITSVARLQDLGPAPYPSLDHLEFWAMLEANRTSPVAWRVCAPPGSSGELRVNYHWITRPGVQIDVRPDESSSCAVVQTTLGEKSVAAPVPRVCVIPWDFLNAAISEEGGIDLDLRAAIGAFVAPQFQRRLDAPPTQNCYDPLSGSTLEDVPTGQQVDLSDRLLLPFYGIVSVERSSPGAP
jgi:hypothetical protein